VNRSELWLDAEMLLEPRQVERLSEFLGE